MDTFSIYNKSSEEMPEITDASIDLIYTSPPYNIGTKYGNFADTVPLESYQKMLGNVFGECSRIIKSDGILVVECADSVLSNGTYIQLSGYIQSLCIGFGFKLKERYINFIYTDKGVELPDHNWSVNYTTSTSAHSNCHQILVLSKSTDTTFDPSGKIFYINYTGDDKHPCPVPQEVRDFILNRYFKSKMTICDPFMGTATFGVQVIKMGGTFLGYEIDESIFALAKENLSGV